MMSMFNQLTLQKKLTYLLLLIGILPATFLAITALYNSSSAIHNIKADNLSAIASLKSNAIENYLNQATQQLKSLSHQSALKQSFNAFSESFGLVAKQDTSQLSDFYHSKFAATYKEKSTQSINVDAIYEQLSEPARDLQTVYISNNHYPVGSKHLLQSNKDGLPYDLAHQKFHPDLAQFVTDFGYYDLFLVDATSGNVIYSVYKEVDFATNLINGPYKDSGLAHAFEQDNDYY